VSEGNGPQQRREESVAVHIFTVSAGMIGVCLTVIGIIHVVRALRGIDTITDGLVALDAFAFFASCLLAYAALRTRASARMRHLERVADGIFLTALSIMAVCCALIACRLV
jgi:hypothetical protein